MLDIVLIIEGIKVNKGFFFLGEYRVLCGMNWVFWEFGEGYLN